MITNGMGRAAPASAQLEGSPRAERVERAGDLHEIRGQWVGGASGVRIACITDPIAVGVGLRGVCVLGAVVPSGANAVDPWIRS